MADTWTMARALDLMTRVAAKFPDLRTACESCATSMIEGAKGPLYMPKAQPGELDRSACGWYWRPHPDDLLKHTETVWACSRCAPDPGSAQFRAGNYRACLQPTPGALYECHSGGDTWVAGGCE